ncbi:hypothetical protein WMY93_018778 [Mugilogobius chulae]|uniref:Uncharacterized protein n=1 Tax=Mugilogobius chulae TaxID=88201 RepID=A0AAW0NRC4_9GOBI
MLSYFTAHPGIDSALAEGQAVTWPDLILCELMVSQVEQREVPGTDGPKKASSEELSAPGAEPPAATGHQPRAQRGDEVKTKPPGSMSQSPAATADHSSWCRGSSEETLGNLKDANKSSVSVSSNQSHGEYPECRSEREPVGEPSLLVSPLVVAGIVIGLVLFLSCITIIVGSLRKDSRLRNPHLRASYGQCASVLSVCTSPLGQLQSVYM